MQCKEFQNQLASLANITDPSTEMQQHMENCSSCRETYTQSHILFNVIAEEKIEKVSPFINTRILSQIEKQEKKSWLARPALVTVMSVALLILGFFSASIVTNPNKQMVTEQTEIIASDYYFSDYPGTHLEEIWLNSYQYE